MCLSPLRRRRQVEAPLAAMRERLRSEEELKQSRKRAGMVEPVFGMAKVQKHFGRFLLRGIDKVQAEMRFFSQAHQESTVGRARLLR
jgi:hypothetical protein